MDEKEQIKQHMKKIYFLIALNMTLIFMQAQNFQWAKREGLYAYDYGYGIGTDNAGNVYVAGKYEDTANFSGITVPCAGNHDIFVARYSSSGALNWIHTGGGILGDYAHSMTLDKTNNYVYVAGEVEGYNDIITFPGSTFTLNTFGDNDIFVSKYDLSGNLLWVKSAGWVKNEKALGVTYDNSGNVYICGYFTDTTKFSGPYIISKGGHDIFVAKYDGSGNLQWVQTTGSSGRDEALSIKCDANGDVYVCGLMSSGCMFGSTTFTCSPNYLDAFIVKYSPSGSVIWAKSGGGSYDDVAWSLTIDNNNKIFVAGEFNAYAVFSGSPLTTAGNADIFIASYDGSGNLQWIKQAGGTLIDRARGIGTDGSNLFITGQFGSTANFGSYAVTAVDSSDIFMASLSNNGTFQWVSAVGGPPDAPESLGYESGIAIHGETNGNVYATGALLSGGVFGGTTLMPYSRTDMFLTKLNQLSGIKTIADKSPKAIYVYPNPATGSFIIDMSQVAEQKAEINIYNSLGQLIDKRTLKAPSKITIELPDQEKGIYIVEVKGENDLAYRGKLIVQ
jgi:hypothetical protein